MIAKIKAYLVAGLGILSVVFYALLQRSEAKAAQKEANALADQLAVKAKASKESNAGKVRENEIRENNNDLGPGRFS